MEPPASEMSSANAKDCHDPCPKIRVPIFLLVCLFSMAAWLDMFGLWVEMPILVQVLPEGWALPSYLTIIMKAGNIAPILYAIFSKVFPRHRKLRELIFCYIIIMVGALACLMLALLWQRTLVVGGVEHSVGFFSLASLLSVVDCTSALVFLPFMARFPPCYMTAYCIGEGLSGLVPGLIGLIQGAGSDPRCYTNGTVLVNSTTNETIMTYLAEVPQNITQPDTRLTYFDTVAIYKEPTFSVEIYFLCMFFMLLVSGAAFTMLNFMPLSKKVQKSHVSKSREEEEEFEEEEMKEMANGHPCNDARPEVHDERDGVSIVESDRESLYYENETVVRGRTCPPVPSTCHFVYLLFINMWICAIMYGMSPALMTYACLPYGSLIYSLCVRLSLVAIPVASLLTLWLGGTSTRLISAGTVVGTLVALYPLYLSIESPTPPLQHHVAGQVLIVIAAVGGAAVYSYAYTLNHVALQTLYGRRGLLWCGVTTQLGSLIGSLILFVLINILDLFEAYDHCSGGT